MAGGKPAGGHRPACAVGKVRRAAAREGLAVDQSPDTGTDRLDELVLSRPGPQPGRQPAPEQLGEENHSGPAEADGQDAGSAPPPPPRPAAGKGEAATRTGGPDHGGPAVSGNTFNGPTALVIGDHPRQHNRFASP
ncbi:hypothetical protein ACFY04_09715 [Streptomyces sp. NPDC001549]|uniref:hypothetical protein n=1 Tax=Streptomyces sp. NPDC001549 TaxID=3364586 RepID=UPI0036D17028